METTLEPNSLEANKYILELSLGEMINRIFLRYMRMGCWIKLFQTQKIRTEY